MALKRILIVALALGVAPVTGCKKKSNTTEQMQSPAGSGDRNAAATRSSNAPNPNGAQSGSAMGTEATAVGATDNGSAGSGSAGSGSAGSGSAGSGSAGSGGGSAR